MSTEGKDTLLLTPEEGDRMEIDTDGEFVFVEQHDVLGGWWFRMSQTDWTALKTFVDKKLNRLR